MALLCRFFGLRKKSLLTNDAGCRGSSLTRLGPGHLMVSGDFCLSLSYLGASWSKRQCVHCGDARRVTKLWQSKVSFLLSLHAHTLSLSLSLSLTHTHAHRSGTLFHCDTHTHKHTHTNLQTHTHTHTHKHTHTHTHTHTNTHTHTHTHTQHTHTHTRARTHTYHKVVYKSCG